MFMYKQHLALDNLQGVICQKKKKKKNIYLSIYLHTQISFPSRLEL